VTSPAPVVSDTLRRQGPKILEEKILERAALNREIQELLAQSARLQDRALARRYWKAALEGAEKGTSLISGQREYGISDVPFSAPEFGDDYSCEDGLLSESFERWLEDNGGRDQDDPKARWDRLLATDPSVRGGANRASSNASSNPPPRQATGGSN